MAREVGRDLGGVVREKKNTENVLLGIFKKKWKLIKEESSGQQCAIISLLKCCVFILGEEANERKWSTDTVHRSCLGVSVIWLS